jgi:Uncharacterized conserved protein
MRLIAVVADRSALLDDIEKMTPSELRKTWKLVKTILPEILKAFKTELNIFSDKDLVTKNVIYIIAAYLSKRPNNSFKSKNDRKMWMYFVLLASVHRRYSGSGGDNKINIDADKAREGDINKVIRNIDEQANVREIHPNLVKGADGSKSNPIFWSYSLMLRKNGAQDWVTGIEFFPPKSDLSPTHIHHIFPKAKLDEIRELKQEEMYMEKLPNKAILKGRSNTSHQDEYPQIIFETG